MLFRGLGDSHEAALYRNLVKELPHYAIFRISPEGRIESWNAGVEQVLGYSEAEFLDLPFEALFTVDDCARDVPAEELRNAATQGRSSDERWHRRKNGSTFFADGIVTAIVGKNGETTGYTKVLRDVTERKIAQQHGDRLTAQFSELAHALDLTHAFIRDMDGKITVWTKGAEFQYGWTRSEAIGRCSHELLQTKFPEPLDRINERLMKTGEFQGELLHTKRDGRVFTVASHWALHRHEHDAASIIEVNNDVTELQNIRAALECTNKKLERANAELVSFAYEVAHDMKAPLRGVSMLTGLLSKSLESASVEMQQELIKNVVQSSRKAQDLIDALLEYATIQSETANAEAVALEETIKHAEANLSVSLAETGASLSWGKLPIVQGQRVRLLRLLQNLIGNAIKYARPDVPAVIRVSAERADGEWRIDVKDNGRGIPGEYRDTVFAPFKRLHGPEVSGAGLGLAICKRIVERQGGRIWVSCEPDYGSIFHFTIPIHPDLESTMETRSATRCNFEVS